MAPGSFRFLTMALAVTASLLFMKPIVGQSNTTPANTTTTEPTTTTTTTTQQTSTSTTLPTTASALQPPASNTLDGKLQNTTSDLALGSKDTAEKAVAIAIAILVFVIIAVVLIILGFVYTHFLINQRR